MIVKTRVIDEIALIKKPVNKESVKINQRFSIRLGKELPRKSRQKEFDENCECGRKGEVRIDLGIRNSKGHIICGTTIGTMWTNATGISRTVLGTLSCNHVRGDLCNKEVLDAKDSESEGKLLENVALKEAEIRKMVLEFELEMGPFTDLRDPVALSNLAFPLVLSKKLSLRENHIEIAIVGTAVAEVEKDGIRFKLIYDQC
ncbi:hypothetical protein J6590_013155 [Homalodisca vitripennis]|nr:hypothetical protein J6590_013155 [Homalodisca vitripennis]